MLSKRKAIQVEAVYTNNSYRTVTRDAQDASMER